MARWACTVAVLASKVEHTHTCHDGTQRVLETSLTLELSHGIPSEVSLLQSYNVKFCSAKDLISLMVWVADYQL